MLVPSETVYCPDVPGLIAEALILTSKKSSDGSAGVPLSLQALAVASSIAKVQALEHGNCEISTVALREPSSTSANESEMMFPSGGSPLIVWLLQ